MVLLPQMRQSSRLLPSADVCTLETSPEKPWFGFADFQAKIKADEDLLLQKYEEKQAKIKADEELLLQKYEGKPSGMSLAAYATTDEEL